MLKNESRRDRNARLAPDKEEVTIQFNIDSSPQISEQLTQPARTRGTDPTHILERLVAEYLPPAGSNSGSSNHNHKYDTPQERVAAMDAIAGKYANAPILQKSAFDRESSYEDTLYVTYLLD